MRYILTGGGTGGHIYPALAVGQALLEQQPQAKVLFVGTRSGMEADIVPRAGFKFATVESLGLDRKVSWRILLALVKVTHGFFQAWHVISDFKPQVVLGTGGYVCAPVVLAAALKKVPVILHEQNAYPGLTNRLLARWAKAVLLTFPEAGPHFPKGVHIEHTGLPVRPEILRSTRAESARRLGLDPGVFTVLVFGGSRGARKINQAMVAVLERFRDQQKIQILQATGRDGYDELQRDLESRGIQLDKSGNITIKPYIYNMEDALAAADLVVSRAGATTIAEITVLGLPAILIPYPFASENHQEFNARALVEKGAAVMILDRDLNGRILADQIEHFWHETAMRRQMAAKSLGFGRPGALADITRRLMDTAQKV